MRRRWLGIAAVVSAAIFVFVSYIWARSFQTADVFRWKRGANGWELLSNEGRFNAFHSRSMDYGPLGWNCISTDSAWMLVWRGQSYSEGHWHIDYWLVEVLAAILPPVWYVRRERPRWVRRLWALWWVLTLLFVIIANPEIGLMPALLSLAFGLVVLKVLGLCSAYGQQIPSAPTMAVSCKYRRWERKRLTDCASNAVTISGLAPDRCPECGAAVGRAGGGGMYKREAEFKLLVKYR